jgi:hypothetical protein
VSMDITPYVESPRGDLTAAAVAGGAAATAAAENLALALDPAVRLALMEALSQAAAEITSELPAGSVELRLRGREPAFVVDVPAAPLQASAASASTTPPDRSEPEDQDDAVARITLRIPESLKAKAEERAAHTGHSLNTWLVHTIRNATRERAINVDIDLSSTPLFGEPARGPGRRAGRRMTGWV